MCFYFSEETTKTGLLGEAPEPVANGFQSAGLHCCAGDLRKEFEVSARKEVLKYAYPIAPFERGVKSHRRVAA